MIKRANLKIPEYDDMEFNQVIESLLPDIWSENITSFGIGILMQLALQKGINLTQVETDLTDLNDRFGLSPGNLHACQLFDVGLIQ